MSDDTIGSGTSFTLSTTLNSGTNIEFLNNAGNSGTLIIEPAAIKAVTAGSGLNTSLVGAAIGGDVGNFRPGDQIVVKDLEQVYAALNVNPANAGNNALFNLAIAGAAAFGGKFFIAANGAVTDNFLYSIGSSTQAIFDDLRGALFGPGSNAPLTIAAVSEGFLQPIEGVITSNAAINTCFTPGTRILTTAGERPVEDLQPGDQAVLHGGGVAPILFIGRRDLDLTRHPRPAAVRPVRIRAGALAPDLPARDLVLSPDHALYLDGVLVQAKDLVDGALIVQDWAVPAIRYYHVELPRHAMLIAEGAAVESYLDTGHRGLFDNGGAPLILHPDLMQLRREAESAAPLCLDAAALTRIRARLHARTRRGFEVAESRHVALRAETGEVPVVAGEWGLFTFTLPKPAGRARLRAAVLNSEVFVPAETDPASGDRRVLGVAIAAIALDGVEVPIESIIAADDLHPAGAGDPARWTRGAARLRLPRQTRRLTLRVAAYPRRWAAVETSRAA